MRASLSAIVLGSTLAAAVPTYPGSSQCKTPSKNEFVNFEDLTGPVGDELLTIPTPYHGLQYTAWSGVDNANLPLAPHIVPQSGSKTIGAGLISEVTSGNPIMSVDYSGSKVKSFDLHSLYYACGVNLGQSAVEIPAECIVEITGFKGDPNTGTAQEICHQRLHYVPSTTAGPARMAKGTVTSACKGLSYVETKYSLEGTGAILDDLVGVAFDDVSYTLNYCDKK